MSPRKRDTEGTTAARAVRRAELLAAAAEVFAARGYAATTVREIADAAGILAGSLYYHFDSKEAMADEVLREFMTDMWSAYGRILDAGLGARETFEQLITESFRVIDRYGHAVTLYQKESAYLARQPRFEYLVESQRRFREMWVSLLRRGAEDGAFRRDLDVELVYRFLRDTVWVAAHWYRRDGRLTADEIAKQYISLVLEGLAA